MSFAKIRQKVHEAAAPLQDEPSGPARCAAKDCPCIGTIQIEGGRWCCTSHAFAIPDNWPRITDGLREHDWLLAFTRDIQSMTRKLENWRSFAMAFWEGIDDYCKPDPREEFVPYFNRMKGELDYRLGLCKRPAPRLPREPQGRGNAARFVEKA